MTTLATINMDVKSPMHIIINAVINSGIVPDHQLKMLQRQAMAWQVRQEKYEARQAEKARVKAEKARLKYLKSRPSFSETITLLAAEFGFAVPNFSYKKEPVQQEQPEPVLKPQQEEQPIHDEVKVCVAEIVEDDEVPENVIFQANRGEWEEVSCTDALFTDILIRAANNDFTSKYQLESEIFDVIEGQDNQLVRMAAYSLIDSIANDCLNSAYEALKCIHNNNSSDFTFKTLAESKQSIENFFKIAEFGMWRELYEMLTDRGCYDQYQSITYYLASSWLRDNSYHMFYSPLLRTEKLLNRLHLKNCRDYEPYIFNC